MQEEDPLRGLLVDRTQFDRERLYRVLKPYVGIDEETGQAVFESSYQDLNNQQKIIVYLLYRVAAHALDLLSRDELPAGPQTVSGETGVNYNSVRSYLSRYDFVRQSEESGGYFIPGYALESAITRLNNDRS